MLYFPSFYAVDSVSLLHLPFGDCTRTYKELGDDSKRREISMSGNVV